MDRMMSAASAISSAVCIAFALIALLAMPQQAVQADSGAGRTIPCADYLKPDCATGICAFQLVCVYDSAVATCICTGRS